MRVVSPNRLTSVSPKSLRNARLFSPIGRGRGGLLFLLLACLTFAPLPSQAARRHVSSSQNNGLPIKDVTPTHRKLSEVRTDLRAQLDQANSSGKQTRTASTTSRQTSTTAKPTPSAVEREILREKCVQLAVASAEVRSRDVEQVRSAIRDYVAWLKILDGVDFDMEKFDENVMILLEKYTAVLSAIEWADSRISAELSLYGKVASNYGKSRSTPVYSTTTYSGGTRSGGSTGNSAPKEGSREAGILAKCSAEIAKLKEEQDNYDAIRKSCERRFTLTLDELLQEYAREMAGSAED